MRLGDWIFTKYLWQLDNTFPIFKYNQHLFKIPKKISIKFRNRRNNIPSFEVIFAFLRAIETLLTFFHFMVWYGHFFTSIFLGRRGYISYPFCPFGLWESKYNPEKQTSVRMSLSFRRGGGAGGVLLLNI